MPDADRLANTTATVKDGWAVIPNAFSKVQLVRTCKQAHQHVLPFCFGTVRVDGHELPGVSKVLFSVDYNGLTGVTIEIPAAEFEIVDE